MKHIQILLDFISLSMLTVAECRYGAGYMAAIDLQTAPSICDRFTDGDSEYEEARKLIYVIDWFPIVNGRNSIQEAIEDLDKKCLDILTKYEDKYVLIYGVSNLCDALYKQDYREFGKLLISYEELKKQYYNGSD